MTKGRMIEYDSVAHEANKVTVEVVLHGSAQASQTIRHLQRDEALALSLKVPHALVLAPVRS